MADHDHDDHDHGSELSEPQLRVRALETVLAEKGYLDPSVLDLIVEHYETKVGPHNGARVVAKAWADPAFKRALIEDATKAVGALGLPPTWYKSAPYRSRAVIDPRGVLADFGVTLPPDTEIRVWDSTAETRFIVLPMRPAGTEGWSEERLAALVTRDSLIGTGLPRRPEEAVS